jgi:hypothetical protein
VRRARVVGSDSRVRVRRDQAHRRPPPSTRCTTTNHLLRRAAPTTARQPSSSPTRTAALALPSNTLAELRTTAGRSIAAPRRRLISQSCRHEHSPSRPRPAHFPLVVPTAADRPPGVQAASLPACSPGHPADSPMGTAVRRAGMRGLAGPAGEHQAGSVTTVSTGSSLCLCSPQFPKVGDGDEVAGGSYGEEDGAGRAGRVVWIVFRFLLTVEVTDVRVCSYHRW